MSISDFIVIGSSRGLGAALVQEILNTTPCRVYGISRTAAENISAGSAWRATGRYVHLQVDIAADNAVELLSAIPEKCSGKICVIYNAAHIEKDIASNGIVSIDAFDRVNAVGINGLGNVLAAFQCRMVNYGGVFVGITSHWGSVAPLFLPYTAYPASKAYLNMVLRCLRIAWRDSVSVVAVTIGNIKDPGAVQLPTWLIPTYAMAGRKIVSTLLREKPPRNIDYPFWHALVYRCVLRFVPEIMYRWIFNLYLKLESARKGNDAKQDKSSR